MLDSENFAFSKRAELMSMIPQRLNEIAKQVHAGETPASETVRTFIGWFGAQRRGFWIVRDIRRALEELEIQTQPDFEGEYIDSYIDFVADKPEIEDAPPSMDSTDYVWEFEEPIEIGSLSESEIGQVFISGAITDPTYRIGRLESANRAPVSVNPNASLNEAITLMLAHDYSQLPVMQNEREVKGITSWESIGSRLALGNLVQSAKDCMDPHHEVSADESLFTVIGQIISHEYVLVRGDDKKITGIVTTSDLSFQFQQLSEPFLLLSEIENHIRRSIDGKFTSAELAAAKNEADGNREIKTVADLTFGEYIRLLENPDNWSKVGLAVDRAVFVKELDRIRIIRNDVMHFDPDGISEDNHNLLRRFVRFLQQLQKLQR